MTWSDAAREAALLARQRAAGKDGSATHGSEKVPAWKQQEDAEKAAAHVKAQQMANKTGRAHVVIMRRGLGSDSNNNHFSVYEGGPAYEGTFMGAHFPQKP